MGQLGVLMEREMAEQPDVLAGNASRYFSELKQVVDGGGYDMVLLAARGSSFHSALFGRYLIEVGLGLPVVIAAPSVVTKYGTQLKYPKTLAVGISQSGAAPDVSDVLKNMKELGHDTLAVTNTPDSRLVQSSDHSLILETGPEESIAATKTYSASLLAMHELARAMGADALEDPAGRLPDSNWVGFTRQVAADASGSVVRSSPVFALGRGYSYCTAYETALKLMECALIPCKAYSTAEFAHGPKALADHGSAAIVFGESPDYLSENGCVTISAPKSNQGPLDEIWQVIFGQWIALLTARARGLNPDQAQNLSKVTKTL